MKNIKNFMVASKGHGSTTKLTAQQQIIHHNHQYYGFTAKAMAQQNEKATDYFFPPTLFPGPLPSLIVPTFSPTLFFPSL